jgi:hypothetical protein
MESRIGLAAGVRIPTINLREGPWTCKANRILGFERGLPKTITGRASQRFALQATALGLKHCFVNQPIEVSALRPQLAGLLGMPGRRPDLVMRFGYGPALPFSPRRPVNAVLS